MHLYYLILVLFLMWRGGSDPSPQKTNTQKQKDHRAQASILSYQVIPSINGTFGYIIYQDTTPFIRQETIPGIQGNLGFQRSSDAKKVATVVLQKIKNGEFPPSVSVEDLKELGVIE